jgi:hypothetical protein
VAAVLLMAHNSFAAEFIRTSAVRLVGAFADIQWTNPHSYCCLDVNDDKGTVAKGSCEGDAPGAPSWDGFKETAKYLPRRNSP